MRKTRLRFLALLLALALMLCACDMAAPTTVPTTPSTAPTTTTPTEPAPSSPAVRHRDDNADELCDNCGIDVTVELDFYSFNDLHGVFNDTDENPGLDELTTFLKNACADDSSYEIVLSAGDMWQGSVESSTN